MVKNKMVEDAKLCYDMVEEEPGWSVIFLVVGGNSLIPFGKIIHGRNNVLIVVTPKSCH